MNLLIVGAGGMGRWVARTVDADVAFADVDAAAADAAADVLDARAVSMDADECFDAVCLAVPISATTDAIETFAPNARRAVFDVSGVMAGPVAAMAEHAPDLERMSLHPLFAPANAPGNVAVVADGTGPTLDAILDDIVAAGNDVFETTPAEHDEAMETVQAGAHTAILAYALAADDVRDEFATPISAGLADLVEGVTGGPAQVYAEIQATFDGAGDVADAARQIADAAPDEFETLYRRAAGDGDAAPTDAPGDDDPQ